MLDRIQFIEGDWFGPVEERFDLIVSNPPYLSEGEWSSSEPEVREHEPRSALVAEEDGSSDLRRLVEGAASHLVNGGLLALETGPDHHQLLMALARDKGCVEADSVRDLNGIPRFLFLRFGRSSSANT